MIDEPDTATEPASQRDRQQAASLQRFHLGPFESEINSSLYNHKTSRGIIAISLFNFFEDNESQ